MLYTLQQIQDIIDLADYVLIKLAEESERLQYMKGVKMYEKEIAVIYDLNQVLKWGITMPAVYSESDDFNGIAAYTLHKVSRYGYVRSTTHSLQIVTQPVSRSVNTGASVTFSVSVLGTPPYTYQWYGPDGLISGATSSVYTDSSAQPDEAGGYYVVVSDLYGNTVTSTTATLTVTTPVVPLTAYYGWFDTNPYAGLLVADGLTYQGSYNFNPGANIIADYRPSPPYKWLVLKFPATESNFAVWNNSSFNFGVIPDQVFRAIFTTGSYKYIVSRVDVSFDPLLTTTFSR